MAKRKPRRPGVGPGGPGGGQQQRQSSYSYAANDANTPRAAQNNNNSTASSQRRDGKGRPQQQQNHQYQGAVGDNGGTRANRDVRDQRQLQRQQPRLTNDRHGHHANLRMPQDRARTSSHPAQSNIQTRPASSETVFAVREFIKSESPASVVDGPARLGRAPLPSLTRLLEQIRVMSRDRANATSGACAANGNMDATVLILSDLWEEASSMKEELELVREQLARAKGEEGLVDGEGVDESAASGTIQTYATAQETDGDVPDQAQVDDGCNVVVTNTFVGDDDDDDDDDDGGRRALLLLLSNPNVAQYLSSNGSSPNGTSIATITDYVDFLQSEDIQSPENLAEALADDEYLVTVLASEGPLMIRQRGNNNKRGIGNGSRMVAAYSFRDAIMAAMASTAEDAAAPTQRTKKAKKCKFGRRCRDPARCKFYHPELEVVSPSPDSQFATMPTLEVSTTVVSGTGTVAVPSGSPSPNDYGMSIQPVPVFGTPAPASTAGTWTCTVCTFENADMALLSCIICDTLRPTVEQDNATARAAVEAALAEARRLEEQAEARRLREREEMAARQLAREQARKAEEEAQRAAEEAKKRAEQEKAAAAEARREKKRREGETKRAAELENERRAKMEEEERRQKALEEKRAALSKFFQQQEQTTANTVKAVGVGKRNSHNSAGVGTPRNTEEKSDKVEQPSSPSSTLVTKSMTSKSTAMIATPSRPSSGFATPSRLSSFKPPAPSGPLVLYPPVRDIGPGESPSKSRGPISSIFKLLRDPSSLPKVRLMLPLETTIARLKLESGVIQLDIAACERQKKKISDEYNESKGKTKKERRSDIEKREKGFLKSLDDRFKIAFRKLTTERDVAKQKLNGDSVRKNVEKKKEALHAKHLAKLEALEEALREKRIQMDRERDEKLGVFRLESIQKSRVEALSKIDETHEDDMKKFDAQRKKSLENLDRELRVVKEKLEKKRNAALDNIDRQEQDRIDSVRANSKVPGIQAKRLQMLEQAGFQDSKFRVRMMMNSEQIRIEDEIAEELAVAQKAMDEKIQQIKESATAKRTPIVKEYEANLTSLTSDFSERRRSTEENWTTSRPKMVEEYERKRQKLVDEFVAQKAAVEEEKKLCSKSVMQQYNEDLKLFEAERLKTTRDIRAQRRLVQPLVEQEEESINREALRQIAEVEKQQKEAEESFITKVSKIKKDLEDDKEDVRKEAANKILKLDLDEKKRQQAHEEAISEQDKKIENLQLAMAMKASELESVRQELVKTKGQKGDPSFNVSTSRDAFGNTFLIVTAQTNDIITARLLLSLGAAPNETNDDGLTAMSFASYFHNESMISLLSQNKAAESRLPFDNLLGSQTQGLDRFSVDWETQLRISEQSAIPPDTFLASADDLDKDEETKMPTLAPEDQRNDFSCFEGRLLNPNANTNFQRMVLIEKSVYSWFVDPDRKSLERSQFVGLLRSLLPGGDSKKAICHRRAVVGVQPQFEVLCSALDPNNIKPSSTVVHFTPFVSSQNRRGIADVGVLIWAVSSESRASYLKALIEQSEWKRNKVVDVNERFLPHKEHVLPLGKNMHLLDLKATSSWKTGPLTLFQVSVDSGELDRLPESTFTPKTRTLESEKILREQLFRRTQSEEEENEQILDGTSDSMSTNLFGGAGTGKTMLLMQKVASDSAPHKKMLIIARLPRLVGFIKAGVKAEKGLSVNCDYYTYDELLTFLARRCRPENAGDERTFSVFNQIHFSETTGTGSEAGVSFQKAFIEDYLNSSERSVMSKSGLKPLTIWTAIRGIKSHASVSRNHSPLTRDEYASLPKVFGLDPAQRNVAFDIYHKYCSFTQGADRFLWDEADRVLYCLKHGGNVFSDPDFVSWSERAFKWGEAGLADEEGLPEAPFYHDVFVDEAQDYSDLDIALFIRLSSGPKSVFLGADPAQSVESGIRMREGGVNDVFNISTPSNVQVKTVLQDIRLIHNHRTHQQNLDLSKAVRLILSRSFCVPFSEENAIAKGPLPEALIVKRISDLGDHAIFKGVNTVFIVPDECITDIRSLFFKLGIKNDVFGVREAKGLEFDACAVLGFFSYFEKQGSAREWQNVIRWLFSKKGIKDTESSEVVNSARLEPCDYLLSHPEIEDQAMMLYTALTRARNQLYIIEDEESGKSLRRGKGSSGLGDFAFRLLQQLNLVKRVKSIDAGENEMTPQEHNARGVLLVTKAIAASNDGAKTEDVVQMFEEAADRFRPDKGNDSSLLHQCAKHLRAILTKRSLIQELKTNFWSQKRGAFLFGGRFSQILGFETKAADFVQRTIDDPFVVDEARQLSVVMEDAFYGSQYWSHFEPICAKIKEACS